MWISLFLMTSLYASVECEKRELRIQVKPGEYKTQSLEICNLAKTISLRSPSCHKDPKSCLKKKVQTAPLESEFGNPKFQACKAHQGSPEFVEVKLNKRWFRTALCYFNNKADFVDTDTVLGLSEE